MDAATTLLYGMALLIGAGLLLLLLLIWSNGDSSPRRRDVINLDSDPQVLLNDEYCLENKERPSFDPGNGDGLPIKPKQ
jgi:hypothetical protein